MANPAVEICRDEHAAVGRNPTRRQSKAGPKRRPRRTPCAGGPHRPVSRTPRPGAQGAAPADSDRADHPASDDDLSGAIGCTCLVSDSSAPVTIAPIGRPCRKFTLSACRQTKPIAKELALSAAIGSSLRVSVRGDLGVDIGARQIDDLTALAPLHTFSSQSDDGACTAHPSPRQCRQRQRQARE
jgi:hypothetical protein